MHFQLDLNLVLTFGEAAAHNLHSVVGQRRLEVLRGGRSDVIYGCALVRRPLTLLDTVTGLHFLQ